jgi:16S rRNA (cytosine967-C5)-methyltransferase
VPIYAIVDEAVKITKKNKYSARGFVNAILREIIREKETIKTNKKLNKLGVRFSVPQWIIDEYINVFGKDLGKQIIQALNNKPPLTVRCNKNSVSRDVFSKILDDNNVEYKYTKISENGLNIKIKQSISNYHWYKDGLCSVQDQGAMIAVEILNPEPDEKVLDMCAAPGGKTTYISELMNNTGIVVAKDIYETRLKQINELSERLNLTNIETIINDGTVLNKEEKNRYDKILVDVPCSGLGVLRRKPEIKHKINQYDIGVIIQTQEKILKNSIRYLKHGGTLVYVTCTVNRQENEEQIDKILQQYPEMKLIKHQYQEKLYHSNDKLYGYTHPLMDQCDCFFIAKLKKDNMEK